MDSKAMQRRYPKWMVFDISDFLEMVKSHLKFEYSTFANINQQNIEQQHYQMLEKLVSHLLEEKFLTHVVNYEPSSEKPEWLLEHLEYHQPRYEMLFHNCMYGFKSMRSLPDQIQVQITSRALYITCL